MYPHPSQEVQHGIAALSQKGKLEQNWNCIQTVFTSRSSQYDNDSRSLEYLSVSGSTTASVSNLKAKLQYSKQHKSYLTCLCQKPTVQVQVQTKHDHNSQNVCFTFHQTVSTTYTVQAVSNDSTCCTKRSQLQFHTTSMITCYICKTTANIPKQTVSTYSLTVHCQPTISLQHQVPPCLQCHDAPSSLSLSTPVPNCQANHHASGLNLKVTSQCKHPSSPTVPAHYRTSGVQHLTHVATKPRSLTKQTRPSRFSCQDFFLTIIPSGN